MGLDMYWHYETGDKDDNNRPIMEDVAYLRKCSPVHGWLRDHLSGLEAEDNCISVPVSLQDMLDLKSEILNHGMEGQVSGFFFGGEWTNDELKEVAIPEIDAVIKALECGKPVEYMAWY